MMSTNMVYQWGGSHSFKVDAQNVGEKIESIALRDGACAPYCLVEEAQDETSPLHPLFTWDETTAAVRWRTHEARRVINSLTVNVERGGEVVTAPAFISVGHTVKTQDAGEGYRPISVVVETPVFREEALDEALGRLKAMQKRYGAIKELAPIWQALDDVAA
jgi:hypothetical protein